MFACELNRVFKSLSTSLGLVIMEQKVHCMSQTLLTFDDLKMLEDETQKYSYYYSFIYYVCSLFCRLWHYKNFSTQTNTPISVGIRSFLSHGIKRFV